MGETDMQPFREHRPTNALTPGALLLMFFGVVLALQDVQWQLVSMASFHAGVSLTAVALCIHLCRRHRAWRLELLVLVMLGVLLTLAPLLPPPFQDFFEYLTP
ncbi:hypothetical protein [Alcanivorax sp.]|jgi:hypothetical protein|uniref:hypothetical protein n=2 Tax=Alcanivorax TaxID=59753 RepID=UPI002E84F14E|nr:hypothetical protein [Pseudomonadota bacterium]